MSPTRSTSSPLNYGAEAESSLADPSIHGEQNQPDESITYEIVPQSSKRGRPKLIDNRGYTFGFQRQRGSTTDWQCVVRPKNNPCKAKVRQKENRFEPGLHCHNHPASVGAATTAKVIASVKAKAVEDLFKPASAVVDEVCFHLFNDRFTTFQNLFVASRIEFYIYDTVLFHNNYSLIMICLFPGISGCDGRWCTHFHRADQQN